MVSQPSDQADPLAAVKVSLAGGDKRGAFMQLLGARAAARGDIRRLEAVAVLFGEIDERGAALELWREIERAEPENMLADLSIAEMLARSRWNPSGLPEAEARFQALSERPDLPPEYLTRIAVGFRQLSRVKDALALAEKASELADDPVPAVTLIVSIHATVRGFLKEGIKNATTNQSFEKNQPERVLARVLARSDLTLPQLRKLYSVAQNLNSRKTIDELAKRQLVESDIFSVLLRANQLIKDGRPEEAVPLLGLWSERAQTQLRVPAALDVAKAFAAAGRYDVERLILLALAARAPDDPDVAAAVKIAETWTGAAATPAPSRVQRLRGMFRG